MNVCQLPCIYICFFFGKGPIWEHDIITHTGIIKISDIYVGEKVKHALKMPHFLHTPQESKMCTHTHQPHITQFSPMIPVSSWVFSSDLNDSSKNGYLMLPNGPFFKKKWPYVKTFITI